MLKLVAFLLFTTAAAAASFPQWARPRQQRRLASLAPPQLSVLTNAQNLSGALFYATCDLPACDTLEFASLDLATDAKTDLFDFPLDSFEDAYVADDVLIGNSVTISLNWDKDPTWGYLATFDLATRKLVSGRNSSSCFALWENPAEPQASLLCLNLVAASDPGCPAGTTSQCTLLKAIDRASGAERLIAGLLANYAPFTVEALDPTAGLIYGMFELLNGGEPEIVTINARTGAVEHSVSFRNSLAFIELEHSVRTGKLYAVVQDTDAAGKPIAYAGTVDPATAVATPLGPKAFFNVSFPPAAGGFFNQFNTISTLEEGKGAGVLFSTAFHYENPGGGGTPPSDPILHLIGNAMDTGELIYDALVANPLCEILWLPALP